MQIVFGCVSGLMLGIAAGIVTANPLVGLLVGGGVITFLASIDFMKK